MGHSFFYCLLSFYLFLRHWQEEIQHPSPSQGALFPSNSPLRRSLRLLLPIGKNIRQQTRFVLASHRIILISSLPFANFLIFRYIEFLKSYEILNHVIIPLHAIRVRKLISLISKVYQSV